MLSSLTVISSVELIAFVIAIVGMPIAVSSHGRIALTMVILGLTLTTDHSLLELGCLKCGRRVSDGVALATHMKLTVGSLLSMTNYLNRACRNSGSPRCDDRDHNERRPSAKDICASFQIVYKSF
jgi:hypothetical protein